VIIVNDLHISFTSGGRDVRAVEGISIALRPSETLALVGESGSGKSVTGLALARLLPEPGATLSGKIRLDDVDVLSLDAAGLRAVRGQKIAYVFQEPMTALNPVLRIGEMIAESVRVHRGFGGRAARAEAVSLLDQVGIPDPHRRAAQFIHQLSGGMRQRVMIALALSGEPNYLVADEPTTALDATVQAQVLQLLKGLAASRRMGLLFISHDLGAVSEIADRVAVMYCGRIVETGPARDVLAMPLMPYTRGLLAALPGAAEARLQEIPGQPADPRTRPPGCAFAPRCALAVDACEAAVPPLVEAAAGRSVRCLRWQEPMPPAPPRPKPARAAADRPVLLEATDLERLFSLPSRRLLGRARGVRAVNGVSFAIRRGEALGVVGESGSGKTTLGRLVLRLLAPSGGSIRFDSQDITRLGERELRPVRRRMQPVFQDPFASLNPYLTVGEIIAEAPLAHGLVSRTEISRRVGVLLEMVGLSPEHASRRPHMFSGGQRQRIAIARALAMEPDLLVADEAVSALDVSIRAQIVNLLDTLRTRLSLAMLFISHDLALVRHLCDRVVVIYLGRVMESGPAGQLFERPRHPYTQALVSAVPTLNEAARRSRIVLQGDVPSPIDPPSGCVFRTRCPIAQPICAEQVPPLRAVGPEQLGACHFAGADLSAGSGQLAAGGPFVP
jgi:peptide/nickel transport system ATP-binding protein